MTIDCKITRLLAISGALLVITPSTVYAGSLLSGYGGPGQGSQAILGSALSNGPGGGGGGSQGGSGPPATSQAAGSPAVARTTTATAPAHGDVLSARGHRAHAVRPGPAGARSSSPSSPPTTYPASEQTAVPQGSGTLGFSGVDVLYALLALGALAAVGALTMSLTHGAQRIGAGARKEGMDN